MSKLIEVGLNLVPIDGIETVVSIEDTKSDYRSFWFPKIIKTYCVKITYSSFTPNMVLEFNNEFDRDNAFIELCEKLEKLGMIVATKD